ncbi:DUF6230 family protein [Streptomyces macrosporus]|uniref:Cholesterol esterase n=1 Tax=Streptomyces macrosporus TaxID=44032 RepID=A0ABP5XMS2_9ACTN
MAAGAVLAGMAQGALAASVAASGNAFKVSGDRLEGSGFTVVPGTYTEPGGSRHPVLVVTAREARLENLCVSLLLPELLGQRMTVVVKAGTSRPVRATGLSVNADRAFGDLRLTDVSAQAFGASKDGDGPGGLSGKASRLVVHDPRFTGWQGAAGSFHLQDLDIRLKPGEHECF